MVRYSATLVHRRKALLDTTFSMLVPPGVEINGFSTSPRVSTSPNISNGTLTWDLKVARKLRVKLDLKAPSACTTPDPLPFYASFEYMDGSSPRTLDACLRKPLYVWKKGCPAIPKATGQKKQLDPK